MEVQLKRWGNSQGIRLPKPILDQVGFSQDDFLDIEVCNGTIVLSKPGKHKTLEERAAAYAGNLNLDGEFDWGERLGREVWE